MRSRAAAAVRSAVPSVVILAVMWVATATRLDTAFALDYWIQRLMQSAGTDALQEQPLATLAGLHIQPPLWNALLAVDAQLTPTTHLFILVLNVSLAAATLVVISGTLLLMGLPRSWGIVATSLLALLPATSAYTFLAYSTTMCGFLAAVAVAGVAIATRTNRIALGIALSGGSVAVLFLLRPAIAGVFVVAWLVLLVVLAHRTGLLRRRAIVAVAPGLVVVVAAQGYFLGAFGLPGLSSWNGENFAHGLIESGYFPPPAVFLESGGDDVCSRQLIDSGPWPDPTSVPACVSDPAAPATGVLVWDVPTKSVGTANYNFGPRLEVSKRWTALMLPVLAQDPTLLLRMAFVPNDQPSGAALYLSASDDYVLLLPIIDAQPSWVRSLRVWASAFPPLAFLLVAAGVVVGPWSRGRAVRSWTFLMGVALIGYSAAVGVLVDYSENNRFRAEIDPALMIAAALAAYSLVGMVQSARRVPSGEKSEG